MVTKKGEKSQHKDISQFPPDMNESMSKHFSGESFASIRELGCERRGKRCAHMEDCSLKDFADFFLWNCLLSDMLCSVEIKHCSHYTTPEEKPFKESQGFDVHSTFEEIYGHEEE